eukprot:gene12839-7189_t
MKTNHKDHTKIEKEITTTNTTVSSMEILKKEVYFQIKKKQLTEKIVTDSLEFQIQFSLMEWNHPTTFENFYKDDKYLLNDKECYENLSSMTKVVISNDPIEHCACFMLPRLDRGEYFISFISKEFKILKKDYILLFELKDFISQFKIKKFDFNGLFKIIYEKGFLIKLSIAIKNKVHQYKVTKAIPLEMKFKNELNIKMNDDYENLILFLRSSTHESASYRKTFNIQFTIIHNIINNLKNEFKKVYIIFEVGSAFIKENRKSIEFIKKLTGKSLIVSATPERLIRGKLNDMFDSEKIKIISTYNYEYIFDSEKLNELTIQESYLSEGHSFYSNVFYIMNSSIKKGSLQLDEEVHGIARISQAEDDNNSLNIQQIFIKKIYSSVTMNALISSIADNNNKVIELLDDTKTNVFTSLDRFIRNENNLEFILKKYKIIVLLHRKEFLLKLNINNFIMMDNDICLHLLSLNDIDMKILMEEIKLHEYFIKNVANGTFHYYGNIAQKFKEDNILFDNKYNVKTYENRIIKLLSNIKYKFIGIIEFKERKTDPIEKKNRKCECGTIYDGSGKRCSRCTDKTRTGLCKGCHEKHNKKWGFCSVCCMNDICKKMCSNCKKNKIPEDQEICFSCKDGKVKKKRKNTEKQLTTSKKIKKEETL